MYKIFTVESGHVTEGVRVEKFKLHGAGVIIPAVLVGDMGRGRKLGVLPVQLLPEQQEIWEEKGGVTIHAAEVGQTQAGNSKLLSCSKENTTERIIVVFRTKIGYRGSNSHTGDIANEWWELDYWHKPDAEKAGVEVKPRYTREEVQKYSQRIMRIAYPVKYHQCRWDDGFKRHVEFHPFPGEIIADGIIAQGAAGRMGSGKQLIALMPKNTVFRTGYSGRLYGAPSAHYYVWTGEKLLFATLEERQLADLF